MPKPRKNRVYFIAAKEELISDLGKRIQTEYPNIEVAGLTKGYFKDKLDIIARYITKSKPDMIY
ncbi:WecB/TagA/CpsF family glycosyltransferase, partial [Lactobacillus jensenii]|uniref:WecB/TagA/CpsF family glycosyltransferase n=1 Tax=Lactobacillus jensenii TaxID=109790 RepID=UPI00286FBA0B